MWSLDEVAEGHTTELHTCLKPLPDICWNKMFGSTKWSHLTACLILVRRHMQVISPCPEAQGEEADAIKWVVCCLNLNWIKFINLKTCVSFFLSVTLLTTLMTCKFICEFIGKQELEKKVLPSRIPRGDTVKYTLLSKAAKCFTSYIISLVRVKKD